MKKTVLLATVCALFLSSCSLFGPGQEEAYDYIKDIMVKYKEKPSDVNAKDFYSDFEGKKVRLNNFALLGITRIPTSNKTVFNEETANRPQPKFRLYLSPMKSIKGRNVAFGGLLYKEGSVLAGNDREYMLQPNVFSPIEMIDEDLESFVITADIFDEKQVESIEKLQTIFANKMLYSKSTIDSIKAAKSIDDEWAKPNELGLNFLLNSIDLTVEFPAYVEDFSFTPISSNHLALNVVEINQIKRLDSPGRSLFEKYYSTDYKLMKERIMGLFLDGLGLDAMSFLSTGNMPIEKSEVSDYFTDREEGKYHSWDFGSRIRLIENILYHRVYNSGCSFWNGYAERIGIKQIREIELDFKEDKVYYKGNPDTYKGTVLNGRLQNGTFIGNFPEELMSMPPIFDHSDYTACVSDNMKSQFKIVKNTMNFFGFEPLARDGELTFKNGNCVKYSYQNLTESGYYFTVTFSEQNQILSIEQNILNATTSVDPTNKTIFMEYTPPNSAKSYTRTLSSETGEVVTPVADSVTQPAQ